MLTFIGLGLYDEKDISLKGLDRCRNADYIYLEEYTSRLTGTSSDALAALYGRPVTAVSRDDLENRPADLIEQARSSNVVLLSAGDPMVSTTHADLRIRAAAAGVETGIIHGASIASAVCGLTGLQNYRFGKSCSVPYPEGRWLPVTPVEVIGENLSRNLHTLVYLDIREDRYMTIPEAIPLLERMKGDRDIRMDLFVGVARAGSDVPVVRAGTGTELVRTDFGPPLHVLVVPAELHVVEREYLEAFAGLWSSPV